MIFREFLNKQILPIVHKNRENINYMNLKTEVFFFQIGGFPSCPKNINHECPPFLWTCLENNVNVNLICIDPEYINFLENSTIRDRITEYPFPVYIYDKIINKDDYICLVEFCHFINNFSCLSIINETTGIKRPQFWNPNHKTPYLYITPSSCEANMHDAIYRPILDYSIVEKNHHDGTTIPLTNYFWYTCYEEELLYKMYNTSNNNLNIHIQGIINYYLDTEVNIYLKILHYMHQKVSPKFEECDLNYDKNYSLFHILEKNLFYRLAEFTIEIRYILDKFKKSTYQNLEVYIKKKIYFILLAKLVFKCQGSPNLVKQNNNYLIFESNQDIENNITWLKQN